MPDRFKWVQAHLEVEITRGQRIIAKTVGLEGKDTRRPATFEESGADWKTYEKLRDRVPGHYRYRGFMGGAVAMLVESNRLRRLSEPLMQKLTDWYGGPWGGANVPGRGAHHWRKLYS